MTDPTGTEPRTYKDGAHGKMWSVGNRAPSMSMSIYRRRAFAVGLSIIRQGLFAYLHRSPTITFWISGDES